MINDCLSGKIDYIITKSVSRFARNTVDCLDHVRMLRARGIGIYFEEQNIDTLQIDSELYLVIYAGFAQSESESISKNVTWTFRKRFQEASPYSTISAFWDTARVQTENRRSSRRRHPSWRGSSICTCQVKPSTGSQPNSEKKTLQIPGKRFSFSASMIKGILRNERYCGTASFKRTVTIDCIGKVRRKNHR